MSGHYRTQEAIDESLESIKEQLLQGMVDALDRAGCHSKCHQFLRDFNKLLRGSDGLQMALLTIAFHSLWTDINGVESYVVPRKNFDFYSSALAVEFMRPEVDDITRAMYDPKEEQASDMDATEDDTLTDIFSRPKKGDMRYDN